MEKQRLVEKYSNPELVQKNAFKLLGHEAIIYFSNRNDKKYMLRNPNTGKFIHFGQIGFEDWTKHQDPKRRIVFRKRNSRWNTFSKYTPAWLSFNILW